MRLILLILLILTTSVQAYLPKDQVLFTDYSYSLQENWLRLGSNSEESLKALLKLLIRSKTGKQIVALASKKARQSGQTLFDVISVGESSLCDTTLVRKFTVSQPDKIVYETRSYVYIGKNLSVADATLDLAHELTHYVFREAFNPYRSDFNLRGFISSTVEGKGGEVDAYITECRVLYELFSTDYRGRSYCSEVKDSQGRLSREKGTLQFYRVGVFYRILLESLEYYGTDSKEVSILSDQDPLFISSAYGMPYPVAALKEYETIMKKVCDNDFKRLAVVKERNKRNPASSRDNMHQKMKSDYERRCRLFR